MDEEASLDFYGIDIASLVPHEGAMCLWQRIEQADATSIRLATSSHADPHHPLRSDGQLRAIHLAEYGAQAMAVHGGLLARASNAPVRPGFLVALRGLELALARIDELPGELICSAGLLAAGEGSQQYGFRIEHQGQVIAKGRAAVMLRD